jgi:hypothetical protein
MNSNPRPRTETYAIIAAIFFILILLIITQPWGCRQVQWALMTQQERVDDTSHTLNQPEKSDSVEDSVTVYNGKVLAHIFEQNYSVAAWQKRISINKVAFDKEYSDRTIDVTGTISKIENNWGCSSITLVDSDDSFTISCSNCPSGTDKWANEVAEIVTGDKVHIRGKYSASLSSNNNIDLYWCHIKRN